MNTTQTIPVGTVFCFNRKKEFLSHKKSKKYWITQEEPRSYKNSDRFYPYDDKPRVQLKNCTKNGKLFQKTRVCTVEILLSGHDGDNVEITCLGQRGGGEKVSQSGKKVGIKRRRISWLKSEISSHQSELARLKKEVADFDAVKG